MKEYSVSAEVNRETLDLRKKLEDILTESGKPSNTKWYQRLISLSSTYVVKDTGEVAGVWKERVLVKTLGGQTKPENANYILVGNAWISEKQKPHKPEVTYRVGKAPGEIQKWEEVGYDHHYGHIVYGFRPVEQSKLSEAISEIKGLLEKVNLA